MNSKNHFLLSLICVTLFAPFVIAQEPQTASASREVVSRDSRQVTIIIQQQQIRFTAPSLTQEVRLEVSNQAGEIVYDSGLVGGPELSWTLKNGNGEAVPSGLYAYTLTFKEGNAEMSLSRRGHLIVERGRDRDPQTDRLWVTSQEAIGAEAALNGGELTFATASETNIVGARIEKGQAAKGTPTVNLGGYGTSGQIPKFGGGDYLVNSVISEDFNGLIGIGTQSPTSPLTVVGQIESKSGGIKFPDGTVQLTSAAGALFQVSHDATLAGNGTSATPLGIADGGVTGPKIANGAVIGSKIASGQVVKSLNGLFDNVNLTAGSNITITPSGNSLNIAAPNLLSSVAHNSTLVGNGTSASPLSVAPLNLSGTAKAMLYVNSEGQISRCYNGLTGSSTGNCGFTVSKLAVGVYRINFGFQVNDRFLSVTAQYGPGNSAANNMGANFTFSSSTNVDVVTYDANGGEDAYSWHFMIIVF